MIPDDLLWILFGYGIRDHFYLRRGHLIRISGVVGVEQ